MEGSVAGVRILPAVVQFHDAEPGVLHQMSLKVQNLSKFSKSVRFHAPDSKVKDLLHLTKSLHEYYIKIYVKIQWLWGVLIEQPSMKQS